MLKKELLCLQNINREKYLSGCAAEKAAAIETNTGF
jgi:hypothetical protein